MKRSEFLQAAALLGLSFPLQPANALVNFVPTSNQKVLIVGAGVAGLTAAYLLKQKGIEAIVLEAAATHGGRVKRLTGFVDFPLPLGGEWLHTHPYILQEVVNDSNIEVKTKTTAYDPEKDYALYEGERITIAEAGVKNDYKFINSSWLDFFDAYIVPSIKDQIRYNAVVKTIDYSKSIIQVDTVTEKLEADQVIVTVPLKMLQKKSIQFSPPLPENKQYAIEESTVWDGFKAFIEFKEAFYPAFTEFDIRPRYAGQKLFYDAAYGQNSKHHVLGLFSVGTGAQPYLNLSDDALIGQLLQELDELFDGKATPNYIKHTSQNWNKEPFIEGAYIYDHEKITRVRTLGKPVNEQVFFAGEAYTNGLNWGGADAAIRSAMRVVDRFV